MKPNWTGVYPAVTTNFFADESLDLDTFSRNIKAQLPPAGMTVFGVEHNAAIGL
ncbi:MAG: hypothetical protein SH848_05915 [Saprospiraceae bacterium]|nr:hypothetical protein [Saprospiraceae bacterium]